MKKISILFLFLLLNSLIISCNREKTTSEKFLEMGETVNKVLDEFEKAREKMVAVFNEFASNVEKYLTNNPKDISQTANQWEIDWKKVSEEIKALESKFTEVESSSKKYFDQLDVLTDNINNSDLRASEAKKNDELRERWDKVYEQAEKDMNNIRGILQEGNDFRNVLLSSAMRAKIDDNIEHMKGISRKAKKILNQLAVFPIDGKRVLKGEAIAGTDKPDKENKAKDKEEKSESKSTENQAIKASKAKASSFQAGEGQVFKAENVMDDDLQTWWSPKTSENIDSEWIMIEFSKEESINGVEIHGGSHYPNYKNIGDLFDKNYRIENASLEFSDGSDFDFTLQDFDQIQTISFPSKKTKFVMLKIRSVYPTTKWKDICVSHFSAIR